MSSPCLDLSRKGISDLPEKMEECKHLECLYLEGNCLTSVPSSLFSSCSNLRWLDLRNNLLTHLPPSIHILRELKTLLLQNNRLTSLPLELGDLWQLSGLSLASNPLVSPPPSVVRRGTSAVLHYLRDQLLARRAEEERGREGQEEGREGCSQEGGVDKENSSSGDEDHGNRIVCTDRPLVLPKQAHIHPHPSPPSPCSSSPAHPRRPAARAGGSRQTTVKCDPASERKREVGATQGDQKKGQKRKMVIHVHPLTSEEKLQANIAIEKQRSKESLGQWQEEARADHLKSAVEPSLPPPITDTAPYATDSVTPQQHHPAEESGHSQRSTFRSSCDHDEVVRVRVQQYNNTLQSQRRQAGLITIPSSNLIEAERKLAEALAQRDQMEERRQREYRLTAFTADPNLM